MTRTALALALALTITGALLNGCKKDSAAARETVTPPGDLTIPIASTDEIWALAPAGTKLGVVVAPNTGSTMLAAIKEVQRSMEGHPIGAELLQKMRADMPSNMPKNILDPEFHASLGLDLSRPAAMFLQQPDDDETMVVVIPVTDPKKLVAYTEGSRDEAAGVDLYEDVRCKFIQKYYACAKSDQLLAAMGQDKSVHSAVAKLPKRLRGHIEAYIDVTERTGEMGELNEAFSDVGLMHGALQLERGGFAAHWHIKGKPIHQIAKAATRVESTLAKRVANKNPAGFWRLSVPLQAMIPPEAADEMAAGAKKLNIDAKGDILDNVTGEAIVYAIPQRGLGLVAEFGAKDGKRLQRAIDFLCGMAQMQLPPQAKEMVEINKSGDRCKVKLDPAKMGDLLPPNMPFTGPVTIEMYTTDISLAIGLSAETRYESNRVAAHEAGRDLLAGSWNMAMWGYGSFSGMFESALFEQMRNLPEMRADDFDKAMFGMWILGHLTELGMGVGVRDDGIHLTMRSGTQWGNDDALLREFQGVLSKTIAGDKSAQGKLKALAEKSPDSPFGRSFRAGAGSGPMVALSMVGVAAAVAIPAFLKYKKRAAEAEAMEVEKLMKLRQEIEAREAMDAQQTIAPSK